MNTPNMHRSPGRLPNFLLIGAMKAGTTSLYHYLKAHPQIFMPEYKAPEFFVEESNWGRGIDWYRKQFALAGKDALAIGEASNVYAKYPRYAGVPQRIAAYIPEARLIYVLRDPINRIRSHYQTRVAEGTERAPFEVAVFKNSIYTDYSRYALQIDEYLKFFPREQLLIITAEDLRDARQTTVRQVYEFLGVDADFVPSELDRVFYQTKDRPVHSLIPLWLRKSLKKYLPVSKRFKELENNISRGLSRLHRRSEDTQASAKAFMISEEVRERLVQLLEDDVRRLRCYMGPEFDTWGIGLNTPYGNLAEEKR
jgi:hypothetical protein